MVQLNFANNNKKCGISFANIYLNDRRLFQSINFVIFIIELFNFGMVSPENVFVVQIFFLL